MEITKWLKPSGKPDIVEAILEGRQPPHLTVEKLRLGAPLLWTEQRKSFRFRSP